jgi:hypothetical protein
MRGIAVHGCTSWSSYLLGYRSSSRIPSTFVANGPGTRIREPSAVRIELRPWTAGRKPLASTIPRCTSVIVTGSSGWNARPERIHPRDTATFANSQYRDDRSRSEKDTSGSLEASGANARTSARAKCFRLVTASGRNTMSPSRWSAKSRIQFFRPAT